MMKKMKKMKGMKMHKAEKEHDTARNDMMSPPKCMMGMPGQSMGKRKRKGK